MSEAGILGKSNYKTMRNQCPLRFIERDGKKILQSPWMDMETGEVEWKDVELVSLETTEGG